MKGVAVMRRYLPWTLIVCCCSWLCSACLGQETVTTTTSNAATVDVNTPNVVLSRELVAVTREGESIQLRKRILSTTRSSLESSKSTKAAIGRDLVVAKDAQTVAQSRFDQLKALNEKQLPAEKAPVPAGPPVPPRAAAPTRPEAAFVAALQTPGETEIGNTTSVPLSLLNDWNKLLRTIEELAFKVNDIEYQTEDVEYNVRTNHNSLESIDGLQSGGNLFGILDPSRLPMQESLRRASSGSSFDDSPGMDSASIAQDIRQSVLDVTEQCGWRLEGIKKKLTRLETRVPALDQQLTAVTGKIDLTEKLLKQLEDATANNKKLIEKALGERDQSFSQYRINIWLVGAVFAMVVSIVLLFLFLWLYPATLTGAIIEHRVFIEVLSMAFLLLTVIILGTGKLLTGEGLAGLLGTIAGYIFARKTAELGVKRNMSTLLLRLNDELMTAQREASSLEEQLADLEAKRGDAAIPAAQRPTEAAVNDLRQKLETARQRAQALKERFDELSSRQEKTEAS